MEGARTFIVGLLFYLYLFIYCGAIQVATSPTDFSEIGSINCHETKLKKKKERLLLSTDTSSSSFSLFSRLSFPFNSSRSSFFFFFFFFSLFDTIRLDPIPPPRTKTSLKKMGSLSPFDPNNNNEKEKKKKENGETEESSSFLTEDNLRNLFNTQKRYLDFFFRNLDLSQTHKFTLTLLHANSNGLTIFFTGVGKSGFVANKISQTLVSLGIRSAFLSPTDALHGDVGIVSEGDVVVLFSKSGNSDELLRLVPVLKARGVTLVGVTSVKGNLLEKCCDLGVDLPLERELCPFDLAPVTSTAIQMVFGDTVAVALMSAMNLTREGYAANHPAGRIGKCLLFKVKDMMKQKHELPLCMEGDMIMDQLVELTTKGCGCLLVIDEENHLVGTFTDGDLRRALKANREGIFKLTVGEMCNRSPRTIGPDAMAVDAMKKMEAPPSPVQFLPVVDDSNRVIGIVTLHGLVSAGL